MVVQVAAEHLHADVGPHAGREHLDAVDDRLGEDVLPAGHLQARGSISSSTRSPSGLLCRGHSDTTRSANGFLSPSASGTNGRRAGRSRSFPMSRCALTASSANRAVSSPCGAPPSRPQPLRPPGQFLQGQPGVRPPSPLVEQLPVDLLRRGRATAPAAAPPRPSAPRRRTSSRSPPAPRRLVTRPVSAGDRAGPGRRRRPAPSDRPRPASSAPGAARCRAVSWQSCVTSSRRGMLRQRRRRSRGPAPRPAARPPRLVGAVRPVQDARVARSGGPTRRGRSASAPGPARARTRGSAAGPVRA